MKQISKKDIEYAAHMAESIPGYEHGVLLNIMQDKEALKDCDYLHSELGEKHPVGNVISSYRDEQGRLHYIIDPLTHSTIIGATGTGKSSLVLTSQIIATTMSGVASMVVVDIKGVLYEQLNNYLKKLGYKVRLLNLTNPSNSEGWNPFTNISQQYYDGMGSLGKGIKCDKSGGAVVYTYKGRTYDSKKELSQALELEMKACQRKMRTAVKEIITRLFPVKRADPYWEESGHAGMVGLAMALITDQFSLNLTKRTTVEQINFAAMRDIFDSFSVGNRGAIQDRGFFSDRGYDSMVYSEVKRIFFENADVTSRNCIDFFAKNFRKYGESFYEITRASTFAVSESIEEKTVDFIVYDESNTVDSDFVGAFIASDLEETKRIADSCENKTLPRPKIYLIDEFPTIPKSAQIDKYIASLRSRGIALHLVIQSLSQLSSTYDKQASTLLNNSNSIIFLGTNDAATVSQFSKDLGKRTIVSPASVVNGNGGIMFEERPVVTCSELSLTKLGTAYVSRLGKNALKGHWEKSWECHEYICPRSKLTDYVSRLGKKYVETIYDVSVVQKEPNFGGDDEDDDDLF